MAEKPEQNPERKERRNAVISAGVASLTTYLSLNGVDAAFFVNKLRQAHKKDPASSPRTPNSSDFMKRWGHNIVSNNPAMMLLAAAGGTVIDGDGGHGSFHADGGGHGGFHGGGGGGGYYMDNYYYSSFDDPLSPYHPSYPYTYGYDSRIDETPGHDKPDTHFSNSSYWNIDNDSKPSNSTFGYSNTDNSSQNKDGFWGYTPPTSNDDNKDPDKNNWGNLLGYTDKKNEQVPDGGKPVHQNHINFDPGVTEPSTPPENIDNKKDGHSATDKKPEKSASHFEVEFDSPQPLVTQLAILATSVAAGVFTYISIRRQQVKKAELQKLQDSTALPENKSDKSKESWSERQQQGTTVPTLSR
jgi:hypothetical protein